MKFRYILLSFAFKILVSIYFLFIEFFTDETINNLIISLCVALFLDFAIICLYYYHDNNIEKKQKDSVT